MTLEGPVSFSSEESNEEAISVYGTKETMSSGEQQVRDCHFL